MTSCPQCGASVAPGDRFCGGCGAPNPGLASATLPKQESASPAASAPAPQAEQPAVEFQETLAWPHPAKAEDATLIAPPPTPPLPREEAAPAPPFNANDATIIGPPPEIAQQKTEQPSPEPSPAEPPTAEPAKAETPAAKPPKTKRVNTAEQDELPTPERSEPVREAPQPSSPAAATGTARATSTGGNRGGHRQLEAGTLLNGRYEIVRRIGGGGMGAVYLAKDRNLGDAPRAVKEMIQSQLDESQHEKAINDFKRESMLLASLEHPSIPTIYDYFYDADAARFYLVMKFISGGDFLARLQSAPGGRLDEKTIADWGAQVADVLDYLHNRRPQIIYRDLKPANLMIDGNSGRVMLIDFGIARWVTPLEKGVTAVGTMGYAPPELFGGKVEPRSDVYSLGATMFHLLTGSDPQDNPLLIFDFNKHPTPRAINPAISNEMERILMRAVEYKPEDRFRSAAELRDALLAHLERLRAGKVSYGSVSAENGVGKTLAVEMVYCGFCGGRIAAEDVFCAHCGLRQPLAGPGSSAALRAARATAKLVVAGTTELDASFLLQKENNLVGRSDPHSNIFPEIDLSRFDPRTKISRRHARIWREGETFLVEDLDSVNGTVVNEQVRLAPRQPRVLESGDRLRLGETTLHFLVG